MRQPFRGRMCTVRSRKRIIDVEIAMRRDGSSEFSIVCLFTRPEAHIVHQSDVTGAQDTNRLIDHRPRNLGNEHDFLIQNAFDIALNKAGR